MTNSAITNWPSNPTLMNMRFGLSSEEIGELVNVYSQFKTSTYKKARTIKGFLFKLHMQICSMILKRWYNFEGRSKHQQSDKYTLGPPDQLVPPCSTMVDKASPD
jgi:hypothetical protein